METFRAKTYYLKNFAQATLSNDTISEDFLPFFLYYVNLLGKIQQYSSSCPPFRTLAGQKWGPLQYFAHFPLYFPIKWLNLTIFQWSLGQKPVLLKLYAHAGVIS